MSEELKKCPFCGSNELYDDSVPSVYGEYTWIRCEKCAAQGSAFLDDEPSKHWNTRPIEDALRKDIMELQQERYAKEIETRATIDALRKQLDGRKEAHDNLARQLGTINDELEIAVEALMKAQQRLTLYKWNKRDMTIDIIWTGITDALAKLQGEPSGEEQK